MLKRLLGIALLALGISVPVQAQTYTGTLYPSSSPVGLLCTVASCTFSAPIIGTSLTLTGQILAGTGSAAAPTYSWSGSSSTGMYFVNDTMRWSSGGTIAMTLSASGTNTRSTSVFNWSSTTDATNTADTGLARYAANFITATDGSTGDGGFRGLSVISGSRAGSNYTHLTSAGVRTQSGLQYMWSSTADSNGSSDTGLARNQAAEIRVTDGGGGIGYLRYATPVYTNLTTLGLSNANSGLTIVNTGDADGSIVNLPDNPTVGDTFRVVLLASFSVTITPATGESIRDGSSTGTTSIIADAAGEWIELIAATGGSGGVWVVIGKVGTWTLS